MGIPRQTKLNLHLLQHLLALARGNKMTKHVFDCQMFSPKLSPNEWNVGDVLKRDGRERESQ
jgi:hypothetical protein